MQSLVQRSIGALRSRLASPGATIGIVALSTIVVLPSLGSGLAVDDYWHKVALTRDARFGPILEPWHAIFTFYDGDPARTKWLVDQGMSPWWTEPTLVASFFRPLSAATHALDYALWPSTPWLMHAHSIAWYAALVAVAAWLYRRLFASWAPSTTPWVAGLATLLYGLDPAHALPAGWLANRNAVVAATFALASLGAHDGATRERGDGAASTRRRLAWTLASALLFALGLASGESALGVVGFFVAHAALLDARSWRARFASFAPHAVVGLAWAWVYRAGGFGVRGSGMYVEPLRDPAQFVVRVATHLPLLLASSLGGPPGDGYTFLAPTEKAVLLAVALGVLLWASRAIVLLWRAERLARFFIAGGVLAALPGCAVFPGGRLLTVSGFGLLGFVALFGAGVADRAPWLPSARARALRAFAIWSCGGRLVLSVFVMQIGLWQVVFLRDTTARFSAALAADAGGERRRAVLMNAPDALLAPYLSITRRLDGERVPARLLMLATGARALDVARADERTVVVNVDGGFYQGGTEVITRRADSPMAVGSTTSVGDVSIEVLRVDARGVPTRAAFRFESSADADGYVWMRWEGKRMRVVTPPKVGEHVALAAQSIMPW